MFRYPITILACLLCAVSHAQTYDILQFGAIGDSNTMNTRAIQAAINKCSLTGGKVVVPKGVFITGTLYLKSNVELHIEEGGTLLGSPSFHDYPNNEVSYKTIFTHNTDGSSRTNKALLFAENVHDISLTGDGAIDGNGKSPAFALGNDDASALSATRPCVILFVNCKKIELDDLHLSNSAYWMQHYLGCDGLQLKRLHVYDHANWNNDGMDIDARNVLVEDCVLDVDDDGICLKSQEREHPVENVIIRNCKISTNCNAIKFGTSSIGGAKNIFITSCSITRASEDNFRHWQQTLHFIDKPISIISGIALEAVDGAIIDYVTVSDVDMKDVQTPIFIVLGNRGRKAIGESSGRVGQIKNILLKNIKATSLSKMTSCISGFPGHDIENVTLDNVSLHSTGDGTPEEADLSLPENETAYPENRMFGQVYPSYGLYVRHAHNVILKNLLLTLRHEDYRPAIILDNVKGAKILNLEAGRLADNGPLVRLISSRRVTQRS